jgi:hypothetical protein
VLRRNTYWFRGLSKTALERNHFLLVTRFAANVPVSLIIRPSGVFNTKKMVHAIGEILSDRENE